MPSVIATPAPSSAALATRSSHVHIPLVFCASEIVHTLYGPLCGSAINDAPVTDHGGELCNVFVGGRNWVTAKAQTRSLDDEMLGRFILTG